MSKRSQDKRRTRAKEKKVAHRKRMGQSPLSRLADGDGDCECWGHFTPDDDRMRSYTVFRAVRGGGFVGAFFLIDYDCIGLKDAFIRLNINPAEIRDSLRAASSSREMRLVRVSVEEVRKEVAAAVKWTRAHPFLLPPRWERTLKVIGALDVEQADVSRFGAEDGGLFYTGRQIDLARRLHGISLEEFLERPDVDYEFHHGDETFRSEELDEEWEEDDPARPMREAELDEMHDAEMDLAELGSTMRRKLLEAVRKWCVATAQPMELAMDKAIDVMLTAALEGTTAEDLEAAERGGEGSKGVEALRAREQLMELEEAGERAAIAQATEQLGRYIETLGGVKAFIGLMGVDEE